MKLIKILMMLLVCSWVLPASAGSSPVVQWAAEKYLEGTLPLPKHKRKTFECLAKNIWFETRGDTYAGKEMVAQVVINRVKSSNKIYKNSICDVVYQRSQFSWTLKPALKAADFRPIANKYMVRNGGIEAKHMLETIEIALKYTLLRPKSYTEATHFCAKNYDCKFKNVQDLGVTGAHRFYKYKD